MSSATHGGDAIHPMQYGRVGCFTCDDELNFSSTNDDDGDEGQENIERLNRVSDVYGLYGN